MASMMCGVLTDADRDVLRVVASSRLVDALIGTRARLVLWADEGRSAADVAALAGVSVPTARLWPRRFAQGGLAALDGEVRPGKGKEHPGWVRSRVLALSRSSPPPALGVSHWSSRLMADHLRRSEGIDVSHVFVADLWRENGLQPWRQGTFKLSRDPLFVEKVADVVGLYLDPPLGALVLSVDEKSQIQALDRTQPLLPVRFGSAEKRTHDYVRHGTTTLFAALDVGTGHVTGSCYDTHTATEFLDFMTRTVAAHPDRDIHVVLDNFSTHKTQAVRDWLAANPRVTFHFTPTSSSWMNQVEIWFNIITKQAIRRGTFKSVKQLVNDIDNYIASYNTRAKPFKWTATAESILSRVAHVTSEVRKLTGH